MSTISPVFSSEPVFPNHIPALETGFTPRDASDLFSIFDLQPVYPLEENPGLKDMSSSDKDERRKKRKLSNRESAKRSRRKKQKHLEDVRSELNNLKIENRELGNRLRYLLNHCQRAKTENDSLRMEHGVLQEKLLNLQRHALMFRQIKQSSGCATWSCINSTVVTVKQNPEMMRDHLI